MTIPDKMLLTDEEIRCINREQQKLANACIYEFGYEDGWPEGHALLTLFIETQIGILRAMEQVVITKNGDPVEAQNDAERYRWLKAQKGLLLESSGGSWSKNGVAFVASHRLCCNGTSHSPYETLDETIDAARGVTDD